MRDLLLNGRFLSRSMTGVDRVATELIRALAERADQSGVTLRMALPKNEIEAPETRPAEVLNLDRVPTAQFGGHLWEQLALSKADPEAWLLSLCNTGPVLRRRQVVMIHDAQIFTQPGAYSRAFRTLYHTMQPRLGRRAQVVLTVSDFSRRELEASGVVPEGKAQVVHNGVDHMGRVTSDPGTLSRFDLSPGGYLLAIGSLAPHKNLAMLVEASRARQDKSVPLIIAGGGNAKVFRDEGLSDGDGVRFIGRVSDGELRALYEAAMALVFPSKTEGFGLPPLEAMYCGCPVIASTGGAVPEACGEAAIYADPARPEEWLAAMERVAADPEGRQAFAVAGQARAKTFTWARAADQVLAAVRRAEETDR